MLILEGAATEARDQVIVVSSSLIFANERLELQQVANDSDLQTQIASVEGWESEKDPEFQRERRSTLSDRCITVPNPLSKTPFEMRASTWCHRAEIRRA